MPIKQPPHSAGRRLVGLRSAIDPAQIPSAPDVALADQAIWSQEPFMTCDTQRTVPLALSAYTTVDQGEFDSLHVYASSADLDISGILDGLQATPPLVF